jgi:predicted Zn-dependent protease
MHAIRPLVLACLACLCWLGLPSTALAQSLLRDAETEAWLEAIGLPIFEAAGLDPKNVEFFLVGDKEINAFVTGGQNIFLNAGLLLEADTVDEVIGVIAHETGHITGGHLARSGEMGKEATGITMLSVLLGAAAVAGGAPDAGAAIIMGGQSAAVASYLSFSRVQESAADQAGAGFLAKSGISGKGLISFFEKLQQREFRYAIEQNGYWRSHPLSSERISRLQEVVAASPHVNTPPRKDWQHAFLRIRAKLAGYMLEPQRAFQLYPESDLSEYGHYARAYAWHKLADVDAAGREMEALLKIAPNDPYYLELQGQILLESGKVAESIPPLRQAAAKSGESPLILTLLGHALLSTEDPALEAEAIQMLQKSVRRDTNNPFAWYQLGIGFARQKDEGRAAWASAERYALIGSPQEAAINAKRALDKLKKGTPEWIRTQDILVVAENELKKSRGRSRGGGRPGFSWSVTPPAGSGG